MADKMAAGSRYGITLKELRELMEFRGAEGVEKLKEYGGAQGLAKKLNTSDSTGKTINLMKLTLIMKIKLLLFKIYIINYYKSIAATTT